MGRLLALRLAMQDYEIEIYDKEPLGSDENTCTYSSGGMLARYAELGTAEPLVSQIGAISVDLWPSFLGALKQKVFFRRNGTIAIAHKQDHAELHRYFNMIAFKSQNIENRDPDFARFVFREELIDLEPALRAFDEAVYFPYEGQMDNRAVLEALRKELLGFEKLKWFDLSEINDLESLKDRGYDYVFDTRGFGAKEDLNGLSEGGHFRGVRGELIRIKAPGVNLSRPVRLWHPRYPVYIVPREDNEYLIGATQIESEDMSPMSLESALELLSSTFAVNSAFADASILDMQVNLRPAFEDHLPRVLIEDLDGKTHLIRVNGLFRHGFLLAPFLTDEISKYLDHYEETAFEWRFPEIVEFLDSARDESSSGSLEDNPNKEALV